MRSTGLYLALSVAPLAICAPVSVVLVDNLRPTTTVSGTGFHQPPASKLRTRPAHALPEMIPWGPDEDDDSFQAVIDNRPITPSADEDPSVVLHVARPIATEYLLALSAKYEELERRKKGEEEEEEEKAQSDSPVKESKDQASRKQDGDIPVDQPSQSISVAEMDIISPVSEQRVKMSPCGDHPPKYLSREQSDIIIISLAVLFLFVVVILETCGSCCSPSSQRREGAIKLQDEKGTPNHHAARILSIQADQP